MHIFKISKLLNGVNEISVDKKIIHDPSIIKSLILYDPYRLIRIEWEKRDLGYAYTYIPYTHVNTELGRIKVRMDDYWVSIPANQIEYFF